MYAYRKLLEFGLILFTVKWTSKLASISLPRSGCQRLDVSNFIFGGWVCAKRYGAISVILERLHPSRNMGKDMSGARIVLQIYIRIGAQLRTRWDSPACFTLWAYAIAGSRMLGYSTCSCVYNLLAGCKQGMASNPFGNHHVIKKHTTVYVSPTTSN